MGITTGYARQPLLALVWILVVWGAGAVLYSFILYRPPACDAPQFAGHAAFSRMGALLGTCRPQRFAPVGESGKSALANPRELQLACFRCQPEASAYPKFNAAMLSADVIVPGLGSGQKDSWSPDRLCGQMVHAFPDSSRPRARAFGGGKLFGYRQNELIGPATSCHLIRRPDRIRQIVLFRDFTSRLIARCSQFRQGQAYLGRHGHILNTDPFQRSVNHGHSGEDVWRRHALFGQP